MATIDESLVRRCCGELDRRIRQGEVCRAEDFFARHPQLRQSEASAIDLIYTEYIARQEMGENMQVEEFFHRFPAWTLPLKVQFDVHQSLETPVSGGLSRAAGGEASEPSHDKRQYVGDFELLKRVAQGGTGMVYKARHVQLRHLVAVKMLLAGVHHDEHQRQRFLAEAAAIARLRHPNIVRWYEFGNQDDQPYLAMEWVEGGTLASRMTDDLISIAEAARLVETVARAVHFAHTQGVIHRDLKPGNILFDSDDQPKVTDFGLAKSMELDGGQTLSGEFIGTPRYAAPEQISHLKTVGVGADIYSLGVILYELLTGRPPILGERAIETVQMTLVVEPTSPRRLRPAIPKDLETICLHCLQKAPEKRYATAQQLADDLRRYQQGEPIEARPIRVWERAWKWAKRRPGLAISSAVSLVALLTLSATTSFYVVHLRAAIDEAQRQKQDADSSRAVVEKQLDRAQRTAYTLTVSQADSMRKRDPQRARELLHDTARCPPSLREFSWRLLDRLCHLERWTQDAHRSTVTKVVLSSDNTHLVSAGKDGRLCVWNIPSGDLVRELKVDGEITDVALSPLRMGATDNNGKVTIWRREMPAKSPLRFSAHSGSATVLAFSRDSLFLVTGGADGAVRIWNSADGELRRELSPGSAPIVDLCLSEDGKQLTTADETGWVRLWDVTSFEQVRAFRAGDQIAQMEASPDGKILACGLLRDGVALFDLPQGDRIAHWSVPNHTVADVAFSRDGSSLFTSGSDKTIRQWNLATRKVQAERRGHSDDIWTIDLGGPDDHWLVSGGGEGQIKLWDIRPTAGNPRRLLQGDDRVLSLDATPDDRFLLTGGLHGQIRIFNRRTAQTEIFTPFENSRQTSQTEFISLVVSPNGTQVACTRYGGSLLVWDFATRKTLHQESQRWGARPRWSPDGSRLATCSRDGIVQIRNSQDWNRTHRREFDHGLWDLRFLSDGNSLVAAADHGKILVWNLQTDEVRTLDAHQDTTVCVSISPDGTLCASGSADATIVLWDTRKWQRLATLKGHSHTVWNLTFSADGRTLASGTGMLGELIPGEVKLWDTSTGHSLVTLGGMAGPAVFADDGQTLITAAEDDAVWLWNAAPSALRPGH